MTEFSPTLFAQADPVPKTVPQIVPNGPTGQPAFVNQPVVINTFENVEMERLRLAEEVAKLERDDADFREQVAKLQAKLAATSLAGITPSSMPNDYRTFISANAGDIKRSQMYHSLLKSLLNDLTPQSPYRARTLDDTSNPQQGADKLLKLAEYEEDDDICRTIRGHIASLTGGRRDDAKRQFEIARQIERMAAERRRLEWNLRMANGQNPLTGEDRATEDDRAYIRTQIEDVAKEVKALEDERKSLSHLVTAEVRKLQFQQFIIELAVQQRYIHALIASGFYRNSFKGADLSLSKEAYPSGHSSQSNGGKNGRPEVSQATSDAGAAALPEGAPVSSLAAAELPVMNTVTGLESFLLNRIRDAIKDREAIDNMLRENQISAAESLLRKMMLTAKYQPELQTLPYEDRQRILQLGLKTRKLSDALNSKDYPLISKLADEIEKEGSDAGVSDLKVFAAEHPRKALHWARQAEVALKAGNAKAAQSLMEAAVRRAPLDPEVARKIDSLQTGAVSDSKSLDDLEAILDRGDYKAAFDRMNEFLPLAAGSKDADMKSKYEALVEREKSLRAALEKSDVFVRRSSYPDAWMVLCEVDPAVAEDPRINLRKSQISGKCARFVSAYTNAHEREGSGKHALALAWYITALSESPNSEELQAKVNELGARFLED